jgi:hypothetical protein
MRGTSEVGAQCKFSALANSGPAERVRTIATIRRLPHGRLVYPHIRADAAPVLTQTPVPPYSCSLGFFAAALGVRKYSRSRSWIPCAK